MSDVLKEAQSDEFDEDDPYSHIFRSIRTKTGLEVGIKVHWPDLEPFELSTCLPEASIAPMFDGTQWAGTRVWRAAIVALEYLLREKPVVKSLVELGCGLGVPGIIWGLLHPDCEVIVSDRESLLDQLRSNIEKLSSPSRGSNVTAASLDWDDVDVQTLVQQHFADSNGPDLLLNCDCIYEPLYGTSWKALAKCQQELLRLRPDCLVYTSVERRRADGLEKYLALVEESDAVKSVEKVSLAGMDVPDEIELYRIHGIC